MCVLFCCASTRRIQRIVIYDITEDRVIRMKMNKSWRSVEAFRFEEINVDEPSDTHKFG